MKKETLKLFRHWYVDEFGHLKYIDSPFNDFRECVGRNYSLLKNTSYVESELLKEVLMNKDREPVCEFEVGEKVFFKNFENQVYRIKNIKMLEQIDVPTRTSLAPCFLLVDLDNGYEREGFYYGFLRKVK